MMTKAKVLSFYFFLYLFSVCVCGACLDDRRGRNAISRQVSGGGGGGGDDIIGSRRSGQ